MADEKQNENAKFQHLLEAEKQIQQAISEFYSREAIFEEVCQKIQSSLGFDFAVISLFNYEKNITETVHESGYGANLSIKCKYYLEKNPYLRNIRADIIQTRRTEIISGWDERFNPWIYDEYNHKEFTRIFTPILLYRDTNGNIVEDWFQQCEWKVVAQDAIDDSHRTVLEIQENQITQGSFKVIGVVITGYANRSKKITVEQAIASAKFVAGHCLKIYRAQPSYILEVIAENARRILQADVAALDFMYEPEQQHYIYRIIKGKITENIWNNFTSRKQGLGREVLKEGKTISVANSGQDCLNHLAKLFGKESQAMVAFPLQVDHFEGFLHLEFHDEHEFTEDEIFFLNLFGNRAINAIWHAKIQADKNSQKTQLNNLYLFTQSLTHETDKEVVFRRITWGISNIMGADFVAFNEYLQADNIFLKPLEIAGKFLKEGNKHPELNQNDKSLMLIQHGTNIYESSLDNSKIFKDSDFVKQENIKSSASILLMVGEEVVGAMFILYRQIHNFSKDEQKLIETLASSAAYAIKNQRWFDSWLDTLNDIERELITTLDEKKLLNKIIQRAVEITKADFGSIRLLLPNLVQLETKAFYPEDTARKMLEATSIEEGISGWVAKNRKSEIVGDILQDSRYMLDADNMRSDLCVPLLDKEHNLLGVLNVESTKVNAFDPKDLRLLEEIANLAVIAFQNVWKQQQLTGAEAMASLGDITAPLVHRTNNNVGAIRVLAQDICDECSENIQSLATEIVSIAEQILEDSQRMRSWMRDKPQIISLEQINQETLAQLQIPENIELQINIDTDLCQVFAGKQQLINVFENLIQNAINAMPEGGKLSIQGSNFKTYRGNKVKVSICDTGVGIPKENLQKIFEPGYSTKGSSRNMGFGLWWTKFYIQRVEGNIEVESEVGKGTQFNVILPAYEQ